MVRDITGNNRTEAKIVLIFVGNDVHPETVDNPQEEATLTAIPSSNTTRSPSPVVTTPNSKK